MWQIIIPPTPVMAFNGVLEAFFLATASSSDLAAQSRVLVIFSALFIISSIIFSEVPLIVILFGSRETGLVYANASSLATRAWYVWVFIKCYYETQGVALANHNMVAEWWVQKGNAQGRSLFL